VASGLSLAVPVASLGGQLPRPPSTPSHPAIVAVRSFCVW
jgi:hypothetical protein